MESISRVALKSPRLLLFVLLAVLILPACTGAQQMDSVAETGLATASVATVKTPAEKPTTTPSPTATSTATVTPSPTPSPTPFPGPNDAEYNMLTCKAVGGVQGFVSFDAAQEGVLDGLEDAIEPAFYAFYEGSDDLLHDVWSHFYQQVGDAPTDAAGDYLSYGVFDDTNYEICLKKGVGDADMAGANLIIPQVQSQETIDAACKNPNVNGFIGHSQATAIYVPEDGALATDFLADIEISDCYSFIGGAQTLEENAIAHLINQYAKPFFAVNPSDEIPEDAVLGAQSYMIFTKDKDDYCNPNPPDLILPIENPNVHICNNGFAKVLPNGWIHHGHDFATPYGTPGYAIADGEVIRVYELSPHNYQVVFDHGCFIQPDGSYSNLISFLSHGDPLVQKNDIVIQGQHVVTATQVQEIELQVLLVPASIDHKNSRSWLDEFDYRVDPFTFFSGQYLCN